jgi:predicted GNAT superfamily acetyltransferase
MSRSAGTVITPVRTDSPGAGDARRVAAAAAARAGVEIVPLDRLEQLSAAADLWHEVWKRDGEPPVSRDMLRALRHAGNYVAGAYVGERLVGAVLGFYAGEERPDHLHSHIMGVDGSQRSRGVAFAMKLDQRAWALERGLKTISWTFDPLVRANGYFNVRKLGAVGVEYLVNFYGAMPDAINRGEESDRILVRWDLASSRVVSAATGSDAALDGTGQADAVCETPDDIIALRRADPAQAMKWRRTVRANMVAALERGLQVTGMTSSGAYVLTTGD